MQAFKLLTISSLIWFFLLSGAVLAQDKSSPKIPNQLLPGTLEKRFEQRSNALSTDKIIIPKPSDQLSPDKAEKITFILKSVALTGNNIFHLDELSRFYNHYIGKKVSLAAMFAVANAITTHYADEGYALSLAYLPAQEIDGSGSIRLVIVEGSIDEIIYIGDVSALSQCVKNQIEKIRAEYPLTIATIERYLLLANDTPGLTVSATLDRAAKGAGKIKLQLDVKHTVFKGFMGLNNRGNRALGPVIGDVSVVYNKFGPFDGQIALRASHSLFSGEMGYYSLSSKINLNSEGTVLEGSAGYITAAPGIATLRTLEFYTNSWTGSLGLRHPLIRSRSHNLSLWILGDLKDSKGDILGFTSSDERTRSARFGVDYDWMSEGGSLIYIQAQVSRGLDILGATKNGAKNINRADADFTYTHFKLDLYQSYRLGSQFSLIMNASAQLSLDPLTGSEQCGFGGAAYGRAFDSFEISGDDCVIGGIELNKTFSDVSSHIASLQPYISWEAGYVALHKSDYTAFAQSVSAGIRATLFKGVTGYAEVALPLERDVALEGNRHPRFFIGIEVHF